ncbi:hypothetical protein Tco_0462640 [Tanacetum coccineum]
MRMEQYLTHTYYALWEVIVNGDAPAIASASAGTKGPIPPKTAEQKLARKNELKAKSTLLLAIPDEHLFKKQRKDNGPTEPIPNEAINEEHVATPSYDLPQSGEDRMQLTELMNLCTQLQSRVLALETTKSNQALEIKSLKRRVKSLEKRKKSRTLGFKRLRKVGSVIRVESSNDVSLGAQEDASKQGRKIVDLDADTEEKEVAKKEVSAVDPVTTAGETLIEIKAAKPKVVTSAATTTTTTRPKARGVVVQEPSKFKTTSSPLQASQLPQAKDKGKAKMVEPEKLLKKKDQIAMDKEVARNLEAQLQVELEEEERISRLKEEKANMG